MSRSLKDAGRGSAKVTVAAEQSSGDAGPAKFDGRSNLHAPPLKQVLNKDQGDKGVPPAEARLS